MKVVIVNKSDSTGGAAVVSRRLMEALRRVGIDAKMLVAEKLTDSPYVVEFQPRWRLRASFLEERLEIFINNGLNRKDLFKVDTASFGAGVASHPLIKEADVVCLNWINQGMMSLSEISRLYRNGKNVIWTMHDMWCMTGICHHAGDCRGFTSRCGDCPFLGRRATASDLSNRIWKRKRKLNDDCAIQYVAVSHWLASRASESSLLDSGAVSVIPNAFDLPAEGIERKRHKGLRIVFGAARLDDPVKGLPYLVRATQILAANYPEIAAETELVTFGNIKNRESVEGIAIPHRHLGILHGEERVREVYSECDIVVSTSLYETLPGTLVEGQAYGCIPVSFDRGGQRDIIDHLSTGYVAKFEDDIESGSLNIVEGILWAVRQGDETRRKMLDSVRERFSYEAVARKYIKLFEGRED